MSCFTVLRSSHWNCVTILAKFLSNEDSCTDGGLLYRRRNSPDRGNNFVKCIMDPRSRVRIIARLCRLLACMLWLRMLLPYWHKSVYSQACGSCLLSASFFLFLIYLFTIMRWTAHFFPSPSLENMYTHFSHILRLLHEPGCNLTYGVLLLSTVMYQNVCPSILPALEWYKSTVFPCLVQILIWSENRNVNHARKCSLNLIPSKCPVLYCTSVLFQQPKFSLVFETTVAI